MARLSGKITPRALGFNKAVISTLVESMTDKDRAHVGRIVGVVNGLKTVINDETGDVSYGLKGQFRGISSKEDDDGNPIVVTAGVCYIPSGLQDMIEGALAKAQEDDEKATIQFGMDLFFTRSTNKAGYTYDGEMLVNATESDPLNTLMAQASNKTDLKLVGVPVTEALTDQSDDGPKDDDTEKPKKKG